MGDRKDITDWCKNDELMFKEKEIRVLLLSYHYDEHYYSGVESVGGEEVLRVGTGSEGE